MSTKYSSVVSINFGHDYYYNKSLPGITVQPVPSTAKLLKNHRMLVKKSSSGFIVLQECRAGQEIDPVVPLQPGAGMVFGIHANDIDFQAKTGIEFYSSNKQKLVIDLRSSNEDPFTGIKLLPVAHTAAIYRTNGDAMLVEVMNSKDEKIASAKGSKDTSELRFDLSEHPEDIYYFSVDGEQKEAFLLLHHDHAYDCILLTVHRGIQEHNILFPARSVHWQYTVVQKYNSYNDLALVDESEALSFERSTIPSKPNALCFTSVEPVKLSERYDYRLVLIEERGKAVKQNIPFANIKQFGKCLLNVHNLCLENYVSV